MLFPFGEDIGVWKVPARSQCPWVGLAERLGDLGDGVVDHFRGVGVHFPKNLGVSEGVRQVFIVNTRTVYSE